MTARRHAKKCPAHPSWDVPGVCTCTGKTPPQARPLPYRAVLPPVPTTYDRREAIHYHGLISEILGRPGWSLHEVRSLQRMERRWRKRALGYDHRWLIAGDKPGRLEKDIEAELGIGMANKQHPDWSDKP